MDGVLPDLSFEDAVPASAGEALALSLDGFDGPIDLLLTLAREQKVDLAQISILALAEQYLAFIDQARGLRLEIAADYLVMAAWLTFLKSRLLLPQPEAEEEPSGSELAEALAFQLRRLQAMQQAGEKLKARPQLGRDYLLRANPEGIAPEKVDRYEATLAELLRAYGDIARRGTLNNDYSPPPLMEALWSVEQALERLRAMLGVSTAWSSLADFYPAGPREELGRRSVTASTFLAALELVRDGVFEIRQDSPFAPIYLRAGSGRETVDA